MLIYQRVELEDFLDAHLVHWMVILISYHVIVDV